MRVSAAIMGLIAGATVATLELPTVAADSPSARKSVTKTYSQLRRKASARLPPPLITRDYLDVYLARRNGRLHVLRILRGRFKKATRLPRFRGPFEVRLYSGNLLVDVIPFSFPLTMAAGEPNDVNTKLSRSLARGVSARATVRVPLTEQLTYMVIVDKALGRRLKHRLRDIETEALDGKLPLPKRLSK